MLFIASHAAQVGNIVVDGLGGDFSNHISHPLLSLEHLLQLQP